MVLDRKAGRVCPGVLGFPNGCAGLADDPLTPCTAALRGADCIACERLGDTPATKMVKGAPFESVDRRHIHVGRGHRCWTVTTFVGGNLIDPLRPAAMVRNRPAALELALCRARQLDGFSPIETRGEGLWRVGNVLVTAEPASGSIPDRVPAISKGAGE